jgi:hypothetical protein
MRHPTKLVLAAALAASLAAGSARSDDEDPRMEARLLAIEGKFREVDALVLRSSPEVQNDPVLRLALGDAAMKFADTKTGEEKRDPLFSARQHYAKVVSVKPADEKAAIGVLKTAQQLSDLDVAARKVDEAKGEAKAGIESGELALAAGVSTMEFKTMLGRTYGLRASLVKTMKEVDFLDSDSKKGATLLADAASLDKEHAGKLLSEASQMRLRAANLIHEGIPVDTEKRDDEALASAIELATRACNLAGAAETDFGAHLNALRLAHSWGMKLEQVPFMTPLGPPLEGLKLELPRSGGWNRGKSPDWDLLLERNLGDPKNDGTVQIMIKQWKTDDKVIGKSWGQLNDMAAARFEKYKEDQAELGSVVEPAQLGSGKNAPDLWHYEVSGKMKGGRAERVAEWIWLADKKKGVVWQMKVIDWRPVPDVEDPDIVAFVASAIGPGLWPPGSAGKPKDDGKGGKKPPVPPTPPKKGK